MTDDEINEAVARKLGDTAYCGCGDPVSDHGKGEFEGEMVCCHAFCKCESIKIPDYCHSIEAAFEIVEKYRHSKVTVGYRFELIDHDVEWYCGWANDSGWLATGEAESPAMAICLAFLKLP